MLFDEITIVCYYISEVIFMHRGKYGLFYEGTLGEFIKGVRKARKINSVQLAKDVGKSGAYVSQIESGKNKNPDYRTLYEIFKKLGIDEIKIDDYLEHFGYISPERLEADDYYMEQMAERENDPEYQEHLNQMALERHLQEIEQQNEIEPDDYSIDWLVDAEESTIDKMKEIKKELDFFIDKKLDVFENVVTNLHSLVMSMRKNEEDYILFTSLFKKDLTEFKKESKEKIIESIKEEHKQINAWGVPKRW